MENKCVSGLVVIQNGILTTYRLDDKRVWEVGRPSKENVPDIKLFTSTISRKHGMFRNVEGSWFYIDRYGKNGTIYNNKHIDVGINGVVMPQLLNDGDVLVFGGGKETVITYNTVWALYIKRNIFSEWRVEDTKGIKYLEVAEGMNISKIENPQKGMIIEKDKGMAIYMGDLTYLYGDVVVQ